ncbi:MAG: hypothetical protein KGM47_04950, partial [Acidobacteriota bacterium]|nr:hypothetical protein [Acidobacteriota bacterium]
NSAIPARAGARRASLGQQAAAAGAVVRSIGTVQSVEGKMIKLKTDSGSEVGVVVQDSTRLLRIQPGQKSLRDAAPLRLEDLQVGDRVLVIGRGSGGAGPVLASSIIAIKRADIAQKQEQEEEAWQKHGVGGLVKSVNAADGTIVITVNGAGRNMTIHTTKDTILRRYAPGSVEFQDAKPGTFAQIQPGNQLRARGAASADGSELTALEIVSGAFQNIAGPIISVNPGTSELTVMDTLTKKPVEVKITTSSEVRALPEQEAKSIAMRLKPLPQGAAKPQAPEPPSGSSAAPDLDQILKGLPQINVAQLQKGDMVMIVSTEQTALSVPVTAIKLVSGVAPILTASPTGNRAKVLESLWSGFGSTGGGQGQGEGASGEGAGGGQQGPSQK